MFDRKSSVVFEGNIPVNMRRGSSTMTVVLTTDKGSEEGESGDKIEAIDEEEAETENDSFTNETRRSSCEKSTSAHSSTNTLQARMLNQE